MLLDRTSAPDFKVVNSIHLPETETVVLDNGTTLHVINVGEQPVARLEVIFEAGSWYESEKGASFFAAKMMPEGTSKLSSLAISEAFDGIGAFIDITHSADRSGIIVYCLSRFLPEVLELVSGMIYDAVFPEKGLNDLRNITLQNLRVNKEKTSYIASVEMRKALFGPSHPYGQSQEEDVIQSLTTDAMENHYKRFIQSGKYTIVLAGQIAVDDAKHVNRFLGAKRGMSEIPFIAHEATVSYAGKELLIEKANSVQSSIRIGRRLFTRHHPDYFKMLVTNEILGGYFGSRLMKNIREEKGLTYGISSSVVTMAHDGYFMIGTDVKKEFTSQTIDEIKKEIHRLQTELVPDDELTTVKNFMAGEFAGSLNSAFEIADRRKILLLDGLPSDFFDQYIRQIHATTAQDVQLMAQRYLNPDDLAEVVVGGK